MMLNRVIYKNEVYYKVADLAKLFKVSAYKMRKIVKAQGIGAPLEKGSGFGRAVFVLEKNVAKIVINNQAKVLKTDFAKNPVQETITVEVEKAPSKKTKTTPTPKKQKKSAQKDEKVAEETVNMQESPVKDDTTVKVQKEQITEVQPEVDEHQKECDELKEEINQLHIKYLQATKGKEYNETYMAFIGDGELDEVMTDNLDTVRQFIEMLKLQLAEFTAQADLSVEYEQMPAF